jgi:hypothetical protein
VIIKGGMESPVEDRLIGNVGGEARFVHYFIGKNVAHGTIQAGSTITAGIKNKPYFCEVIHIKDVQFSRTGVTLILLVHLRAPIEDENPEQEVDNGKGKD